MERNEGMARREVAVRVPASTTNLGPGFDALGLALRLHNRVRLRTTAGPVRVRCAGEGAEVLETGSGNLVYRAAARLFEALGQTPPPLEIELENRIPVSRGLGSSSAAIVGGLVAANALLGEPLSRERLLELAAEMEGHPDNVAPALFGGFQIVAQDGAGLLRLAVPPPAGLRAVVCIPNRPVSTAAARAALPAVYPRQDVVFNLGRVALLVGALLRGETRLLRSAMQDRIHQPYRAQLVPGFEAAVAAALEAGAAGACLSGSGSTLLALTTGHEAAIGAAMAEAVRATGADARWMALDVDTEGAVVEAPPGKNPEGPAATA